MNSLGKKFGSVLLEYRTKAGLTQEELATDCELDRTYISLLERGKRIPTLQTIFSIAAALSVSPTSIVRDVEKR